MISDEIAAIFNLPAFRAELQELSSTDKHKKQEKQIAQLLANYLRDSHAVVLEQYRSDLGDRVDLTVDRTCIEFKYHFDCDMQKLQKEMDLFDGDVGDLMNAVAQGIHKGGFKVAPAIHKDIFVKQTDIFVLILCSRDLRKLTYDELCGICWVHEQLKYNCKVPYGSNEFLETVDGFLAKLQELKKFYLSSPAVHTEGIFPSDYHLRICDFTKG